MNLKKVLVFGGTHGNEWTGVYAVKKYSETLKNEFPDLDLHFIHANPEAHKLNKRFKDEDLNRAFQFLNESRPHSYENGRAREIKALIEEGPCFVVDLHTTTSNMGNTVIVSHPHQMNFFLSALLTKNLQDTRVIFSPDPSRKYLASQSEFSMMIEVGPVPNGVLNALVLENTLSILREILKGLSTLSNLTSGSLEIYEETEDVYYPQNSQGELSAYLHTDFQGKDFVEIEGEYTPFKSFDGQEVKMRTTEKLYPIFINEAAYYPVKLAYTLCKKKVQNF